MTRRDGRYSSPTRDRGDTMNIRSTSLTRVVGPAIVVIVPLVVAAWLPPGFPHLVRQVLLCTWGLGAILVAERMFFSDTLKEALRAVGFVRAQESTLEEALLASLPMWAFLPLFAWTNGTAIDLRPEWLSLLLGVVLVNGVTEEVIHRGFVFGHVRRGRSFATAATVSATLPGHPARAQAVRNATRKVRMGRPSRWKTWRQTTLSRR